MNTRVLVTAFVFLLGAYQYWTDREVKHAPGILVREAPEQTNLTDNLPPLPVKDATITPLANYKIRARALGKERYWLGQSVTFVPYDVFKDGSEIKSSLSRDDSGAGACEVMWVTSINVTNY